VVLSYVLSILVEVALLGLQSLVSMQGLGKINGSDIAGEWSRDQKKISFLMSNHLLLGLLHGGRILWRGVRLEECLVLVDASSS